MKKIAFTLVAVSALGLAACGGNKAANNTASNESNVSVEATNDVLGAGDANATSSATNSADSTANASGSENSSNSTK